MNALLAYCPVAFCEIYAALAWSKDAFDFMNAALAVLNAGCTCGNTLLAAAKAALA